jgi:hypothetical protein
VDEFVEPVVLNRVMHSAGSLKYLGVILGS